MDGGAQAGQQEQTGGEAGTLAHSLTHSLIESGWLTLEFVAATTGRECKGRGLCLIYAVHLENM